MIFEWRYSFEPLRGGTLHWLPRGRAPHGRDARRSSEALPGLGTTRSPVSFAAGPARILLRPVWASDARFQITGFGIPRRGLVSENGQR